MQVTFEQLEGLTRQLTIRVPEQRVEEEVEKRFRAARPKLRVSGFRAGKVPPQVLKQKFGAEIRREALSELIDQSYREAVIEQKLTPVSAPNIEFKSGFVEGEALEFTATFEVMPEVKVRGLDALDITLVQSEVKDEDINTMLQTLQRQQAIFVEANDNAAVNDDRVTIDFIGRLNGEAFEGGSGENMPIILGAGQMLPDFENGLLGMKVGEEKTFDVAFPEQYHSEALAGKTAQFTAKLNRLESMKLPEINSDFIKKFGIQDGDEQAFKKAVRENMEREMNNALRRIKRERLFDALVAANQEQEIAQSQIQQEALRMAQNMGLEKQIPDAQQRQELAQRLFEAPARRQVLLSLLFGQLFEERQLELDQARVEERLQGIAATYEKPEEVLAWYRKDQNARRSLESAVLEEQMIDALYENAKITYENKDFQELMAINNQLPR